MISAALRTTIRSTEPYRTELNVHRSTEVPLAKVPEPNSKAQRTKQTIDWINPFKADFQNDPELYYTYTLESAFTRVCSVTYLLFTPAKYKDG